MTEHEEHIWRTFEKLNQKHVGYFSMMPPLTHKDKSDSIHNYYFVFESTAQLQERFKNLPKEIQDDMLAVYDFRNIP